MTGSFITFAGEGQSRIEISKSVFIGNSCEVNTASEAESFVAKIRAKYPDARHVCYAWRISGVTFMQKYSDDGEPQGTAGVPVLDAIRKAGIVDVVVVVTRYFGGVLLGTGGLVRAYSHSASLGLKAAQPVSMVPCAVCSVTCSYTHYGKVSSLVASCGGVTDDTAFDSDVHISFHIPTELLSGFQKQLADATSGDVTANVGDEKYFQCAMGNSMRNAQFAIRNYL